MIMAFCFWLEIDDDNFLNLLDEVLGFVLLVWPKTIFLLVEINKTLPVIIRFRAGLKLSSAII
ncbi:hypothetical protein NC652_014264 [Populus alba x Populus x berolinensis]|uniref:Uncharacterized protein n=1 Tax=Populus alba x Populus x berolinensis TaxID=444605 RepID=A0AAD6QWI8_9ROSI|nr:hypothetical protein NC652_014264 [Populus alba x Populus x berolinensis]KAJ6997941.1 hypothetical protein NC653_014232 [Populus alba x Populus x berolinensis]